MMMEIEGVLALLEPSPDRWKWKEHLYTLSITECTLAFLSGPSLIVDWVVHNAELNFLKFVLMMKIFNDDDVWPLPPWRRGWCRCWGCCGWSWSSHLMIAYYDPIHNEIIQVVCNESMIMLRYTLGVLQPMGSIIQVGSLVSSHLIPPAVLSSPINLDFLQSKSSSWWFSSYTNHTD